LGIIKVFYDDITHLKRIALNLKFQWNCSTNVITFYIKTRSNIMLTEKPIFVDTLYINNWFNYCNLLQNLHNTSFYTHSLTQFTV